MRSFDFDFLIDGEPILVSDAGVQITERDIVISGTDESGVTHRDVLRSGVLSITIPYSQMTREEFRYMRSLVAGKAHFAVSLLDLDGQIRNITAHCEKIPISVFDKLKGIYKQFSLVISES